MNLVGFLNRSRTYPAPLISVGAEGQRFFAFYPSGHKVLLRDIDSIERLNKRPAFVSVSASEVNTSEVPVLAFGISRQHIVAGAGKDVGRVLRTYISSLGPIANDDEAESIRAFLLSIGEFTGKINARELVEVLTGRRRLVARVNSRQLRRSPHKAQTLLIQLEGKGGTKTLYRKGVPRGRTLDEVRIPAAASAFLQQGLF
jgi:hypothetical protein